LIQRRLYQISLDIEKTVNIYRETIEDLVEKNDKANGENSKDK